MWLVYTKRRTHNYIRYLCPGRFRSPELFVAETGSHARNRIT